MEQKDPLKITPADVCEWLLNDDLALDKDGRDYADLAQLALQNEALSTRAQDAARWRWLREQFSGTDIAVDGMRFFHLHSHALRRRGHTIEEVVDKAMAEEFQSSPTQKGGCDNRGSSG